MLEIKVILAYILRNFQIECDQSKDDLQLYNYIILRSEIPVQVTLKERTNQN